ncbi:oxidoreductase [Cryptosporidium bovis]|uniref:oxidoreductase n=1 Tax=Cryptosporidium bovis TaxID=310047 RepID=UPI00351A32CD|nr:oxidoreductase [Cryptosporidium bovis]
MGKTVMITGCTSGIGLETTRQLLEWGVTELVLCCRDKKKIEKIGNQIRLFGKPLTKIHIIECDLTSLKSVEACSKEVISKLDRLDILINNAGIMASPFKLVNGVEFQFISNYLGHFYLTTELLPLILKSKSRIINVSSIAHLAVPFGFDISELENVNESSYNRVRFYGISKLCNIYFTRELQIRYGHKGVSTFALHPGCVDTGLSRYIDGSIIFKLLYPIMKFFAKTPFTGAQTTLFCCYSKEEHLLPGGYYSQCSLGISSPISLDLNASKKLWEYSETLCKKAN